MVKSDASPQASAISDYTFTKRKHFDDHESQPTKKKARTRVSYSCGECHRRKQKCDRQMPCSHCIARKVPELCKAYTPGKSEQDIHLRLARLEHIIETALPQYAASSILDSPPMEYKASTIRRRFGTATPDEDSTSQLEDVDISAGTFQSGNWYGNSASGSIAPAPVLDQLQQVGQSKVSTAEGSSRSTLPSRFGDYLNDLSARQGTEPSAVEKLQSLIQDCGVSPNQLMDLLNELPPRKVSDQLVDYYFESLNWTRYPISESDFRSSYNSVCTNGILANPSEIRFIPLLFVVLAITVRLAPDRVSGKDTHTKRISSLRYYWSSRRALLIAAAIQTDSLELVLTRLLSARFLTFDRRITECWSQLGAAVCTAQALGLHRDGAAMGLPPAQVEYRRRIWAYLYHADRSYALVLGRPNAIHDEYTSTLPPLNIEELLEANANALPVPPPLSTPTRMTYVILRHTLGTIIGRMVHHFQQVRTSHYSEVLALDDDLQRFIDSLPPHFSLRPDTSYDVSHEYIMAHRFLLITEILFVRISLHRPYILRRLGSDKYAPSRKTCFTSAMLDFEVRQAFRMSIQREQLDAMSNAYREFQTAMIAGIYLVLEPYGVDAPIMHAILDVFLKEHEGVQELQSTTRREIKIIEFLKSKATSPDRRSTDRYEHNSNGSPKEHPMNVQANLLLSLQHSRGIAGAPVSQQRTQQDDTINPVLPGPSGRLPFLTLAMGNPVSPHTPPAAKSPSLHHKPRSPTFQRIAKSDSYSVQSPLGSGSPGVEDEPSSAAQTLLDQWYNAVSNYPQSDFLPVDAMGPTGHWNTGPSGATAGDSVWLSGSTPFLASGDIAGIEGADWNLWENLVNQIRGGP